MNGVVLRIVRRRETFDEEMNPVILPVPGKREDRGVGVVRQFWVAEGHGFSGAGPSRRAAMRSRNAAERQHRTMGGRIAA